MAAAITSNVSTVFGAASRIVRVGGLAASVCSSASNWNGPLTGRPTSRTSGARSRTMRAACSSFEASPTISRRGLVSRRRRRPSRKMCCSSAITILTSGGLAKRPQNSRNGSPMAGLESVQSCRSRAAASRQTEESRTASASDIGGKNSNRHARRGLAVYSVLGDTGKGLGAQVLGHTAWHTASRVMAPGELNRDRRALCLETRHCLRDLYAPATYRR